MSCITRCMGGVGVFELSVSFRRLGCQHDQTCLYSFVMHAVTPLPALPPCHLHIPLFPLQNPNKSVAKNHHQMILRADNASEKYDWLARLRHATEPGVGGRARIAGKQQQGGGAAAAEQEPEKEKVGAEGG